VKYLFLIFMFLSNIYATPLWYYNITDKNPQVIIGYGSGESEAKAKQNALSDVVSKISTQIDTSMKLHVEDRGGEALSSSKYDTVQKSSGVLSDYKLLKMEFVGGQFYVAVWYENIPSFDKFLRKIKIYDDFSTQKNSYLLHTYMAKKLKEALNKDIDFRLARKDKKWYIKYKNTLQVLDKKGFRYFVATIKHKDLDMKISKERGFLYDGEEFYFKVKSKKSGFVSIITVYEDGTVSTLLRNIPIKKNRVENLPDKDFESIPEAGLIQRGVETYDMYVVIYSKKRLYLDEFAYADSELINEEKYKNFDRLIEFLNGKVYSTLKVVTKPRI